MTNKQRNEIEGLLNNWVEEVLEGLVNGFGSRESHTIVDEIEKILEEKEETNTKPIAFQNQYGSIGGQMVKAMISFYERG